ncbi:MAG: dockerin type I repeat-containing protein [Planctomycetota bacterium]|nr:dockerin type I repeat-containing protein [Planctomycetota bacterium]
MYSMIRVICVLFLVSGFVHGQPDVIVGDLPSTNAYGSNVVNGETIFAYSVATTSCNIGTQNLDWIANNNRHPVIAQEMWRLHDGRFSKIGGSWLKHGFCALQNTGLCPGCGGGGGCLSFLTPGCADPYSAGLNGNQSNLGPRSQVDAFTGFFPYPYNAPPIPGGQGTIARRLQVKESDLLNANFPGALYFVSGQYVALDDAEAGNQANNSSYRRVNVSQAGNHNLSFIGSTQMEQPAIQAWQDFQPTVTLVDVQVPNEGLFIAGYDVIDNQDGTFNYEYAILNLYSHRSASSFTVPYPAGASIISHGFHDTDWHSGETVDGTEWTATLNPGLGITWSTETFAENPDANALRWAKMFNFYFTCDAPPADNTATMGLYRPGTPTEMSFTVSAPSGNFLPAVQELTCSVGPTVDPSVDLSWINGESYTAITVRRNGTVLAVLGGSETSYTDTDASYGNSVYTVQGEQGAVPSAAMPCEMTIAPLSQTNFSCSQLDPDSNSVSLSWTNGMTYDAIEIHRNGALIATLGGSASQYADSAAAVSTHVYEMTASVGGFDAETLSCNITVLPPPPLGFTLLAPAVDAGYDTSTGVGQFTVDLGGIEDSTNTGFPNSVTGYSLAMVFDSNLLIATGISEDVVPSDLDFFDGQFGGGFVTIGAVVDFLSTTSLDLSAEVKLAQVSFSTNPGGLINQTETIVTALTWQNGVIGGSLPVDNLIVVGSNPMPPAFSDGQVTLSPGAGVTFVRGDINGDDAVNIADAVAGLTYLFSAGPASCIDAVDTNDDGLANVADGVFLLSFLFSGGPAPSAPFPGCGSDPTNDALECDEFNACP